MMDLWPDDLGTDTNINTPLTILRQQGKFLSERTKNIVIGEVSIDTENDTGSEFTYRFKFRAPLLSNYSYELLSIEHDVIIYPLKIYPDALLIEQIADKILSNIDYSIETIRNHINYENIIGFTIGTSSDLEFTLSAIFSSLRTRQIIESLIAQSKSIEVPKRRAPLTRAPQPLAEDEDLPF